MVAVLAVVRMKVKMNRNAVVVIGLVLAAMAPVAVKAVVRVASVVVLAAVKMLKIKTRQVVAVFELRRVAVMIHKEAVTEVGLMLVVMKARSA